MIELIHGRGQLGSGLQDKIANYPGLNCKIYHTWNFLDKSEPVQKGEYFKFKKFVDEHRNAKIIFISTLSKKRDDYVKYKTLAEEYLFKKNPNGKVIRLSFLLGKGICEKFKKNEARPYGIIEILTINDATNKILTYITNENKVESIHGEKVSAKLVYELIRFGAKP